MENSLRPRQSCTIAKSACGAWRTKRGEKFSFAGQKRILICFHCFRLRNSKILIAGVNGLGAEIAKNIILAGVKSVTFLDQKPVTELDFASQFFVPRDQIGQNRAEASIVRAQALNPMVDVNADTGLLAQKDEEFFSKFDVVVIIEASQHEQIRINNICRVNNVKYYAADLWGMFGYSFVDLQKHDFVE